MKISDIIIIIIIIFIVIIIIYAYVRNRNNKNNEKSSSQKQLKNIQPNNIIDKKSEKETYKYVERLIIDVINNRFNYNYKLDKEEEKLLYPNYKAIADRIIQRALKYYNIYEIKELAYHNAYDFVTGVPNLDSQFDKIVSGLQINAINYLIHKFPKIEPHIAIKYIKSYKNIFPITEAVYKNNKLYFTKEQMNILDNFENFLKSKNIK